MCQADTAGVDAVTPVSPFLGGNEKALRAEMTAMQKKKRAIFQKGAFCGKGRLKEGNNLTQNCELENMSELEAF